MLLKDGRTNSKYNAVTRMKLGVKKSINDICMLLSDGLCRGVLVRTCTDCEISERTKNETFARYKKQNNELKSTKKKLKRTEGNCTVG